MRGSMKLTINLHLVSRIRMSGAIPLLPLYASMAFSGTYLLYTSQNTLIPYLTQTKISITYKMGDLVKECKKVNMVLAYVINLSFTKSQK
jgi:hypothetical protein